MGDLKPIGSEKLQGMEKINRMIEISRYKEYIPKPINEDSSTEYKKVLSDGNTYQIIKEKNGYVIKKGISESVSDYIEPMKNRRYYNSYSQALKRLNLIAKEVNVNEGYDKNLSLFAESDDRYFLKTQTNEQETETPVPAPAPAPAPEPVPAAETPAPAPTEELPTDDMPEPDVESGDEDTDEEVTYKTIQKLTGKLGQKIRTFLSNEENKMTSKDIKYVINSILSALDINSLEPEDKEEIMMKFEGGEESPEGGEVDVELSDIEGGESPEMSTETPTPPQPEGEMGEGMFGDDEYSQEDQENLVASFFKEGELDETEEYPRHKKHGSRTVSKMRHKNMKQEESEKVEEMMENIFSESKVESVLKKYFKIEEKEKLVIESKERLKKSETEKINKTRLRIKNLSESISQEVASTKLVKKFPSAKLVGKNVHNKCLVFELHDKTMKVTPKGSVI